jgi:hypothetical protein
LLTNKPNQERGMNNSELIRTFEREHLLSVIELLSRSLLCPDEDFKELEAEMYFSLEQKVLDYLEGLTDYERLKVMQLIINTLIHEAEKPTVEHFQTLLPLKSEQFYRP